MKVILYMAMTINGLIAKANDETPWSDDEWESYEAIVKQFGNLVIGRKTLDLLTDEDITAIDNPKIIVVSSTVESNRKNIIYVKSPEDALRILQQKGFDTVLLGGGGSINASFMEKGLVDEIYLDIEPQLFGKGIPLFNGPDFSYKLELLEMKKLNENLVQLHYKVMK